MIAVPLRQKGRIMQAIKQKLPQQRTEAVPLLLRIIVQQGQTIKPLAHLLQIRNVLCQRAHHFYIYRFKLRKTQQRLFKDILLPSPE